MRYRKGGLSALIGKVAIVAALLLAMTSLLSGALDGERAADRACRSAWSLGGCDRSVPVDRSEWEGCRDVAMKPGYCIPD